MNPPQQPKLRLKDRRRRLLWVKVAAGAAVTLIALALVVYVSRLPSITIAEVHLEGTHLVDEAAAKMIVSEKLSGSYAFIIPHANAFFYPRSIGRALLNAFPPIEQVTVSRNGLTALSVSITEREAVADWCAGNPPEDVHSAASNCYLMDSEGFIYAPSSDSSLVRYYGMISENPIGQRYLPNEFGTLEKLVNGSKTLVQRTPAIVTVDQGSNDASVIFAEGGIVRFERTADPESTLNNIASVFASQSFKDHADFEYIDFRFGDKVYAKFK
jgi:hypothetical protein